MNYRSRNTIGFKYITSQDWWWWVRQNKINCEKIPQTIYKKLIVYTFLLVENILILYLVLLIWVSSSRYHQSCINWSVNHILRYLDKNKQLHFTLRKTRKAVDILSVSTDHVGRTSFIEYVFIFCIAAVSLCNKKTVLYRNLLKLTIYLCLCYETNVIYKSVCAEKNVLAFFFFSSLSLSLFSSFFTLLDTYEEEEICHDLGRKNVQIYLICFLFCGIT